MHDDGRDDCGAKMEEEENSEPAEKSSANSPDAEMPDSSEETTDALESEGEGPSDDSDNEKGGRRRAIVIAVLLLAAICLGAGALALSGTQPQEDGQESATQGQKNSDQSVSVELTIDAEGWVDGSSPFLMHVTGETSAGEAVDFWHAVWSNGTGMTVNLPTGTYRIDWISAINADGSIYRTPETPVEVVIDDATEAEDSDTAAADIEESFEQVPADQVTQDDLDAILDDIEGAVGSGDDTLTGEAGQAVVDTAAGNAANNPNADKDAIEDAKEEAEGNVADTPDKPETGTGNSQNTGNEKPATDSKPATGSDKPATDTKPAAGGGSSSSSGSKPSGDSSKPAHTHSWVAQTSQQWVQDSAAWDEQVWVQDSAAWDETVQTGSYVQCSCGYSCGSTGEWDAHVQAQIAAGSYNHSYSVVPKYETIHHDATGHYETVHHDATGHYETVTTGYKCSECGATK